MVLSQRKLYLFKDPEGVKHFQGGWGSNFFQGGPNAGPNDNIYRNPHNLCFSRGSGPPIPTLDPHMGLIMLFLYNKYPLRHFCVSAWLSGRLLDSVFQVLQEVLRCVFIPCLVLVQPQKHHDMTEKLM